MKAAPVRQTAYRRQPVETAGHVSGSGRGRSGNGALLWAALTTVSAMAGFSVVTLFFVAVVLNSPAPSTADFAGPEITAAPQITPSMAAAPSPEGGMTIVQKAAVAPAKRRSEIHSDAVRAVEPKPAAVAATDRHSNAEPIAPEAAPVETEDKPERDGLTEVFRTELQNAERAMDAKAEPQPQPEAKELARADPQSEPSEPDADQPPVALTGPVPKPKPRPADLAANEPSGPVRSARVRTDVNMRAGPRNSAAVIIALHAGHEVKVMNDCEYWCEVIADGKRGWIYKKFVQ